MNTPAPHCWKARLTPTVKVVLTTYGNNLKTADIVRIGKMFTERFNSATEGKPMIEIVDHAIIDFKEYERDLTHLRNTIKGDDTRRADDRLTRLWYYYQKNEGELIDEIHQGLKEMGMGTALSESDAVLALSGPQFEGLGFASGGYGLTEQPSEIAWGLADGGTTQYNSDEKIVDELMHEMGHLLGLDHASAKCFKDELTGMQRAECCKTSPGQNDVMSYCRDRSRVDGSRYWRFTQCTKDYLQTVSVPALLNGDKRGFQERACD